MKTSLRKLLILLVASGFVVLAATGCQTTRGFGEDVERLGESIQDD
jgi:predicted small secreted protein